MAAEALEYLSGILDGIRPDYPDLWISDPVRLTAERAHVMNVSCLCRRWVFIIGDDVIEREEVRHEFDQAAKAEALTKCQHSVRQRRGTSVALYPTSAASMSQVVGTGEWTSGYLVEESSGSLAATFGPDLSKTNFHMVMAGGTCGDATCTKCDPMDRDKVDGLTVRECMDVWLHYRDLVERGIVAWSYQCLKPSQIAAAKAAWSSKHGQEWSAQLRAKAKEAREKERQQVVCDWQDEP